ncbi:hypothetical protein EB241_20280 [Erwinia psidii]|uniref:Uncharacterized protein n=1 Tax=Erwinia psidii TaxID=69224 RepID=A0A3N6SG04_9GAMM|nr:hypothetical protein EB241_20280 [Erwinia psidii]
MNGVDVKPNQPQILRQGSSSPGRIATPYATEVVFIPCAAGRQAIFPTSGIWHLASGIWHLASGIWHLASGIWHLASGIWHLANRQNMQSLVG